MTSPLNRFLRARNLFSSDGSVTVDVVDDEDEFSVDLKAQGGTSVQNWLQSGNGDPITLNPTTPNVAGGLYFDESGVTGLWTNPNVNDTTWVQLGGIYSGVFAGGLSFAADGGAGFGANGARTIVEAGPNLTLNAINPNTAAARISVINNGTGAFGGFGIDGATQDITVFVHSTSPSGVITPDHKGDLCIEGTNGSAIWQAFGTANTDWVNIASSALTTQAGAYSMTGAESVVLAAGAVTLPSPSHFTGGKFFIKDNGGGTASVLPNAAETIDGAASILLSTAYEGVEVTSDGTNWFVIAQVAATIL